jgi:hypothetical protein
MERMLKILKKDDSKKSVDYSKKLSGRQRVSLVEDLRIEMAKVAHYEYPQRLRRVLEISHR